MSETRISWSCTLELVSELTRWAVHTHAASEGENFTSIWLTFDLVVGMVDLQAVPRVPGKPHRREEEDAVLLLVTDAMELGQELLLRRSFGHSTKKCLHACAVVPAGAWGVCALRVCRDVANRGISLDPLVCGILVVCGVFITSGRGE